MPDDHKSGPSRLASSIARDDNLTVPRPAAGAVEFRDPTKVAKILKAAVWISIAIDVVAIMSGLLELQLLQGFQTGKYASSEIMALAEANDSRQRIVGIAQITVFIVAAIVFLRWTYIVHDNKRGLGGQGLSFTPGWALGWFFVPVANLWKPYQAMREAWQVSVDPFLWQQQSRSPILPWWWFLWLASNILEQAAWRLSLRAEALPQLVVANIVSTLANCAGIAAAVVAIAVVGQISRMQLDRKQRWDALIGHDEQVRLVIERLRPLGQKWVDKFLSLYLAMNDRNGLPELVRRIIANARTEDEEDQKKISADEEKQLLCDLEPLDGREGPFQYRARYFYSYPNGKIDGYTRAAGWWRFPSLEEFQAQVDNELNRVSTG
jgi:hypothetical protein